jgi:hypothetical protein
VAEAAGDLGDREVLDLAVVKGQRGGAKPLGAAVERESVALTHHPLGTAPTPRDFAHTAPRQAGRIVARAAIPRWLPDARSVRAVVVA